MSSGVYWQQVTPDEPLGSSVQLKWLLFDKESHQPHGEKLVISWDSPRRVWLEGWLAGHSGNTEALEQFLADLQRHGQLEVWIDE